MRYDDQGDLVGGVAERWELREDGATFWLRKDARWSDGRPVTAADFVFAWRQAVRPQTASQYAFILFPIANAEAIIAPHGAGLTNLVFCAPGARVVELFPSLTVDCYYRLSVDLGLEYGFVKARQFRLHRRIGEDFSLNPGDVAAILDHMRL